MFQTKLTLSNVTLVSVTGVHVDQTQQAMLRSMSGLTFAKSLLISTTPPTHLHGEIEWVQTPPMTIQGYSRFILKDLLQHIETSHVLIVQADGFVLNAARWDPAWLAFDYVGAPWPERLLVGGKYWLDLRSRVGNGGFSLRSRRLLELTAPVDLDTMRFPTRSEDVIICHLLYDYLVSHGMRFPDVETAARFSIEGEDNSFGQTLDTAFGFHGKAYLGKLMARDGADVGVS